MSRSTRVSPSGRRWLVILACSMVAGGAAGQVVTPPPGPRPAEPAYTPPAPAIGPRVAVERQVSERQRARLARNVKIRPLARPIEVPIDAAYDGPVERYERQLALETLRYNPLVEEELMKLILPVLERRRADFERRVIEHADVVVDLKGGLIDQMSFRDRQTIEQAQIILEAMEGVTSDDTFLDEALNEGAIDRQVKLVSDRLIEGYQRALQEEVARVNPDEATNEFFRMVLRDSVREAISAHDDLLAEAATRIDEVLSAAEPSLPGDVEAGLRRLSVERAAVVDDPAARAALVGDIELVLRPVSVEQRRGLLEAVVSTRLDASDRLMPVLTLDRPAGFWDDNPLLRPEGEGE